MTPEFQYALYDTTQATVLPAIASKIGGASGTLAPCSGTTAAAQTACAQTFIAEPWPGAGLRHRADQMNSVMSASAAMSM